MTLTVRLGAVSGSFAPACAAQYIITIIMSAWMLQKIAVLQVNLHITFTSNMCATAITNKGNTVVKSCGYNTA